ncbi:BglG family transcription antiterminator [Vagococcus salmoninarum]
MSLTNKWYQILNILLVKRQVASDELGQMTNLSSQTLKKNIELLNEQLAETAEITHNKKEFELQISNLAAFQTIMTGKLKKETDFNSSGKRMAYILKSLINTGDFVLIDDLSEVLQVSRGTVNKDIKAIKKQIMDFGVSLQGVPNKGIQIVGDEFNLRLIILQGVYDFYSDEYPLTEETKKWADGLAKYYKLDQSTLALLKKVIAISIARILNKLPMNEPISYYNNFEYNTDVMQDFMIFLEKEYLLTLGKYDQDFISFPINTRTTAMVEASHMAQYEIGVREVFDDMMAEIRNNFITELDDEELFEILKYHLMFMLNRIIFHVELFDLFMAEIQLKYPFSFELAKVAVSVIETKLMIPMNPIEASYLTIYFELVLNKKTGDAGTKKVAIVCSTGRGTAALIHRQLKEVLGTGIEIVQYSETDY